MSTPINGGKQFDPLEWILLRILLYPEGCGCACFLLLFAAFLITL